MTSKTAKGRDEYIRELKLAFHDKQVDNYQKNIDIYNLKMALRDASAEEVEVKKAHRDFDFKDEFLATCLLYGVSATATGCAMYLTFRPVLEYKAGYQAYFAGDLQNYPLPPEVMARSIAVMEGLPKPG